MLFSLSLFISLIIRYCTLLKSAVSISRSLANYNADIRHGVRRVVYFEPISRFRRFRFATRTIFVSNIRGIRGTRSRIIVSIVVVPLDSSTVIAATVIVARRVEWNFAICNRVSRRKLVEENFVEFVRRGVSRFLNVSANCSHNRYLRSRNIEQRLHNKLANGKLHNYSAFLDPPCLLLIRKSMALHFAPYILRLFELRSSVGWLTSRSRFFFALPAMCILLHVCFVFTNVWSRVVNEQHEKLYNPRSSITLINNSPFFLSDTLPNTAAISSPHPIFSTFFSVNHPGTRTFA